MPLPLKQQAINTSLSGNWTEAARLNIEILKDNPKDTEALNRLGFALSALGNVKEAKETYDRVLEIDPLNPIASRGLKKLANSTKPTGNPIKLMSTMFLEESGKTKIVSLLNTAPVRVLRNLQIGQTVVLSKKRNKIFVLDEVKEYIGVLPEDLGKRLIKFIDGGNIYEAYVKAASDHGVTIFMKEARRANRFKNQPSFLFGDKTHLAISKSAKRSAQDLDEDGE